LINNLLAEFSCTGNSESENFSKQAKQLQTTVKQDIYDKFQLKIYRAENSTFSNITKDDDFNAQDCPLPMLDNYQFVGIAKVFQHNWIDITLLGFYGLLFFVCAFVSFLRFDVR
jgi:predicted transcriptional regulator